MKDTLVGVALVLTLALPGPPVARADEPPLTLHATAEKLDLDESAALDVEVSGARTTPRLEASCGRFEPPRPVGDGRWLARYVAPGALYPQVAILVARVDDRVAFTPLPLWGRGLALVVTRPHGRVTARIGDTTFGPVTADERGVSRVPVRVPPGVRFAYDRQRPIDLHLPDVPHLYASLDRSSLPADRRGDVVVHVFAVDESGAPRANAALVVTPSRGRVEEPRPVAGSPGAYTLRWSLDAGPVAEAQLTVALADAPRVPAIARLQLPAGAPATIRLTPSRERIVAGEGRLKVGVSVEDAAGNPAAGEPRFRASLGRFVTIAAQPGHFTVEADVPSFFAGSERWTLDASLADEPATAHLEMPLVPGPPTTELPSGPARVRADGRSQLELRLRVHDRFGNPIADRPPAARAEAGRVAVERAPARAEYLVRYTPPERNEPGADRVAVGWAGDERVWPVALAPRLRRVALAPKVGLLTDFGVLAPIVSVEAAARFELLRQTWAVLVGADWTPLARHDVTAAGATVDGEHQLLTATVALSWRRALGERWRLHVAAGGGLATIWSSVRFAGQGDVSELGYAPAATAALGLGLRTRFGVPFVEARFVEVADPHMTNLHGALSALVVALGYGYELL